MQKIFVSPPAVADTFVPYLTQRSNKKEMNTFTCDIPSVFVLNTYPLPVFICITRKTSKTPNHQEEEVEEYITAVMACRASRKQCVSPYMERADTHAPKDGEVPVRASSCIRTHMAENATIIGLCFAGLLIDRENAHPTRSRRGYTTHRTGNAVLQHNGTTFRERNI